MFTQVKDVRVECDESSTELERVWRNSLDNSSTDPICTTLHLSLEIGRLFFKKQKNKNQHNILQSIKQQEETEKVYCTNWILDS